MQSTCPHIHSENKFSIFWHKSFIPRLGTSTEVFSNYQTKQFGVFCRKLHSTYPEKRFDENSFFQKLGNVLPLTDFEWKVSCLLAEKLLYDCRNCTYLFRLHFKKNLCRSLCRFFSFVLHFDRLLFCRIFLGCVVKTALFVPVVQIEANIVLKKCIRPWSLSDIKVDRFGLSRGISFSFVKFAFFLTEETFRIKIYLLKNTYLKVSGFWEKTIRILARRFWARFSELPLHVHSNVFMTNSFFEKRIFFSISSSVF